MAVAGPRVAVARGRPSPPLRSAAATTGVATALGSLGGGNGGSRGRGCSEEAGCSLEGKFSDEASEEALGDCGTETLVRLASARLAVLDNHLGNFRHDGEALRALQERTAKAERALELDRGLLREEVEAERSELASEAHAARKSLLAQRRRITEEAERRRLASAAERFELRRRLDELQQDIAARDLGWQRAAKQLQRQVDDLRHKNHQLQATLSAAQSAAAPKPCLAFANAAFDEEQQGSCVGAAAGMADGVAASLRRRRWSSSAKARQAELRKPAVLAAAAVPAVAEAVDGVSGSRAVVEVEAPEKLFDNDGDDHEVDTVASTTAAATPSPLGCGISSGGGGSSWGSAGGAFSGEAPSTVRHGAARTAAVADAAADLTGRLDAVAAAAGEVVTLASDVALGAGATSGSSSCLVRESRDAVSGRFERVYSDGLQEVLFPNGLRKLIYPGGHMAVIFQNGDVKETFQDGSTCYRYRAAGATQTTLLDGTSLFLFASGQRERHAPDGSKEIEFPNGARKRVDADGSEEVVFPDGTVRCVSAVEGTASLLAREGVHDG